jgi:hypothetical protein
MEVQRASKKQGLFGDCTFWHYSQDNFSEFILAIKVNLAE